MAALLLCGLPDGSRDARSWILGQVTLLASRSEAVLKLAGSGEGLPGEPLRDVLQLHVVPPAEFSVALFS